MGLRRGGAAAVMVLALIAVVLLFALLLYPLLLLQIKLLATRIPQYAFLLQGWASEQLDPPAGQFRLGRRQRQAARSGQQPGRQSVEHSAVDRDRCRDQRVRDLQRADAGHRHADPRFLLPARLAEDDRHGRGLGAAALCQT